MYSNPLAQKVFLDAYVTPYSFVRFSMAFAVFDLSCSYTAAARISAYGR